MGVLCIPMCGETTAGRMLASTGEVAVANFRNEELITAVQISDDSLKLICWSVDGEGFIHRLGDSGDQARNRLEHRHRSR